MARLITPTKFEIGRISTVILEKIYDIRRLLFLSKQNAIRWFHQLRAAARTNKKRRFHIIHHARKWLLSNKEIPWQKKNTTLFDVAVGAYGGAEVCEIVGLFLLNNLANKFDKNSVGLYRDDGLCADKVLYVKNSTNYLRKTDYL